jgi:hypothetical protein
VGNNVIRIDIKKHIWGEQYGKFVFRNNGGTN